jgi:glucose-6-phosphate isomerase
MIEKKPPLHIDYAFAMAEGSKGGLPSDRLKGMENEWQKARAGVLAKVDGGELGFWRAPADQSVLRAMEAFCAAVPSSIEDVLVLGIGGSSLGTRAILQALVGPPELAFTRTGRRVHLPDNSDPWFLAALLPKLDPSRTLVLAVSKSGGTVETAAQLLVVRAWLEETLGAAWTKHLAAVTDPKAGPLREFVSAHGLASFDVPPNIGGRFSVLTPVGLLAAMLAGVDVAALLRGATTMAESCERTSLAENPAGIFAAVHFLHHKEHGRMIHVFMPYADGLRSTAAWFVQLWAESLGKRTNRAGKVVEVGPTPLPAVGATDQHAQMQLFMEGPRDKLVTFIEVETAATDFSIPPVEGAFGYLGGHTLHGLLSAELRGTRVALAADGRPSLTISLPTLSPESLGALLFLLEAATAFAGELYDINAFDQPGVEAGKRLAFGLLGKAGFEDARRTVEEAEACRPSTYRVH